MTRSNRRTRALLSIGVASLTILTACGSDDDSSAATDAPADGSALPGTDVPADTDTVAGTEAPAVSAAAAVSAAPVAGDPCATWIAADDAIIQFLFAGAGDADSVNAALDTAIASAPDDNVDTLVSLQEAAAPQLADPESEAGDETLALYSDAIAWAGESCDDVETIDVTATEYHYDGIPSETTAGYKVLNFSNEGQEAHEMFAFRINDGVTESLDQIFELPEEEIFTKITPVNATFAPPGGSDVGSWHLATPGSYAVVCFVPVGSVGETEGDGPPHFTQGMVHEMTVS